MKTLPQPTPKVRLLNSFSALSSAVRERLVPSMIQIRAFLLERGHQVPERAKPYLGLAVATTCSMGQASMHHPVVHDAERYLHDPSAGARFAEGLVEMLQSV